MEDGLNEEDLKNLQENLNSREMIIIKFTADWCAPCRGIKDLVEDIVKDLPSSIKFYEIDINDSVELYAKLKTKKMVNGIPAILGYKDGTRDNWYIPDDSVLGGNKDNVSEFFKRCLEYVNN